MNFFRQKSSLEGGPISTSISETKIQLLIYLDIKIIRRGGSDLDKDKLVRHVIDGYRGPGEMEALYIIGVILSERAWVKKKNGEGFAFRGEFNVKFVTENKKLKSRFEHEQCLTVYIKDWTILTTLTIKSAEANRGYDIEKDIRRFFEKYDYKHHNFDLEHQLLIK
ncbi:matrix [Ouango virus]|uniref:Matrix n=1 Tax=Ouango virus TaxID=864692 RepID=A0AAE8XBM7_9RHAB|nr:matrix [Ouango virus]UAU42890.1 matrix [Ouango virus]